MGCNIEKAIIITERVTNKMVDGYTEIVVKHWFRQWLIVDVVAGYVGHNREIVVDSTCNEMLMVEMVSCG